MNDRTRSTRRLWTVGAAILAGTLAGGCALFDPPSDEVPPHGGLPPGVSASPATTQTGPVTSPMPTGADMSPSPNRQPMGNFVEERTPRVIADTATRAMAGKLDSVIRGTSQGLTSMPIPVARGLIRSVSSSLDGVRAPRVRSVVAELDSLHALLGQQPMDSHAVGHSLLRLSSRAHAASPEAGVLAGRVARLADLLQEAGTPLARQRQ